MGVTICDGTSVCDSAAVCDGVAISDGVAVCDGVAICVFGPSIFNLELQNELRDSGIVTLVACIQLLIHGLQLLAW